MQNTVRSNREDGIFVELGSTAEIIGNVSTHNGFMGILVNNSTVTIVENISEYNERSGIVLFDDVTVTTS